MSLYADYRTEVEEIHQQRGYWSPLTIMGRLNEENGEVSRELNHLYGEKKKRSSENAGDIEEEIGDILYTIICFANANGYDNFDRSWFLNSLGPRKSKTAHPLSFFAQLSFAVGCLSYEVELHYGKEDKTQNVPIPSVDAQIGNTLRALAELSERISCPMGRAFRKAVNKTLGRDKYRF